MRQIGGTASLNPGWTCDNDFGCLPRDVSLSHTTNASRMRQQYAVNVCRPDWQAKLP